MPDLADYFRQRTPLPISVHLLQGEPPSYDHFATYEELGYGGYRPSLVLPVNTLLDDPHATYEIEVMAEFWLPPDMIRWPFWGMYFDAVQSGVRRFLWSHQMEASDAFLLSGSNVFTMRFLLNALSFHPVD